MNLYRYEFAYSKLKNGKLNDTECEKCYRTLLPLLFLGVDPNNCGFNVTETTFNSIRSYWEQKNRPLVPYLTYIKMQEMIPDQFEYNVSGSKEFIEWFQNFDFPPSIQKWSPLDLYMSLPYSLATVLRKIYNKLGINIRIGPCLRN